MATKSKGFIVEEDQNGLRLDVALTDVFSERNRSQWQKTIKANLVFVNGEEASAKYAVKTGDAVTVIMQQEPMHVPNIPIIYEDNDVIVIDKPCGVLSHSKSSLAHEQTVADVFGDKVFDDDTNRPGIVHRLDRDTSGVMILAKTPAAKQYFQKQFQNRSVQKTYVARVSGIPKHEKGIIKWPIERNPKQPATFRVGSNGKSAETQYSVIAVNQNTSLLELKPKTGRTHQLRVHLAHLGHPIIGDRLYGGASAARLMLHAHELEISIAHDKRMTFTSPIPEIFYD